MSATSEEIKAIPVSNLDSYEGSLVSSDMFLFSQSGDGVTESDDRYETTAIESGYVSRAITYENLVKNISSDVGIEEINDKIKDLDDKKADISSFLDARWIRTINVVSDDELPEPSVEELTEHGDLWPDYLAELDAKGTIYKNPRYINNIFEKKGNVLSVGVNDLSAGIRDCFDKEGESTIKNPVGRLIPPLNDVRTKRLEDQFKTGGNLHYITGTNDKEGRISSFTYEALSSMFYRIFNTYELSTLIPGDKLSSIGGTVFVDYYSHRTD